jgi:hypothetical protein
MTKMKGKISPEKKAKQLVSKFKNIVATDYKYDDEPLLSCQKEAAIIVVNEVLSIGMISLTDLAYYEQVKEEIKKLT